MTWTSSDIDAVRDATFKSTSFLKRGYDMEEVDEFLDEVVECMEAGEPLPDLSSVEFAERSGGYHETEVDRFLLQLARHEASRRVPVPAGSPAGAGTGRSATSHPTPGRSGPVVGASGPDADDIDLTPLAATDTEQLVAFLTGNTFPFHKQRRLGEEQARDWIAQGHFAGPETRTLWVDTMIGTATTRLGLVVLQDLQDHTPMFDLRLAEQYRGRGYALPVMKAVTGTVFSSMPRIRRFAGQTREDNIAMRKTLLRCGFIKEAHYRQAWPVEDGRCLASVSYAILRQDWETGRTTSFVWEDLAG